MKTETLGEVRFSWFFITLHICLSYFIFADLVVQEVQYCWCEVVFCRISIAQLFSRRFLMIFEKPFCFESALACQCTP